MEDNKFESVYSSKVKAGKRRTYFFDVRKTKGEDYYITLTESTKRYNGEGYDRHKIFLYKEDFDRFQKSLEEVINHIKTELMPDYDYEEYTRRQKEWEDKIAAEDAAAEAAAETEETEVTEVTEETEETEVTEETETLTTEVEPEQEPEQEETETEPDSADESDSASEEDDMSW